MANFSFHVLGGCNTQTPERYYIDDQYESCVVAETDDALYVMDAGDPAAFLLREQGLRKPIRGVFISHMHSDHASGLLPFLLSAAGKECTIALPIPEAAIGMFAQVQQTMAAMANPIHCNIKSNIVPLHVGFTFTDGDFTLECLPNDHMRPLAAFPDFPYKPYVEYTPSFSFRVTYAGMHAIFSGDYPTPCEIDSWLNEGADLAVLDCCHVPRMQYYAKMLAEYPKVRRIAFTHCTYDFGTPDELVAEARAILPASTEVMKAVPGMEFRFSPAGPGATPQIIPFAERLKERKPRVARTAAEIQEACREQQIQQAWQTLGPFDNPYIDGNYRGLDQDHGIGMPPDLTKTFIGKDGETIAWQPVPIEAVRTNGWITLHEYMPGDELLGYAYRRFEIEQDGTYDILCGSDDGMRMWIDGQEVLYINEARACDKDGDRVTMELIAGSHDVLLAIEQRFAAWIYAWRIVPSAS